MALYTCEIKGSGAALDAYLNEYHIYSDAGASHSYSTVIRAWMEKENLLRLVLTRSVKAGQNDVVQFKAMAEVIESSGRSQKLVQMAFPGGVAPPSKTTLPFDTIGKRLLDGNNLQFNCADPAAIVPKPWNLTSRTIADPAEIYKLYGQIQKNFVDGNVDGILALSRARIAFCAKIYDQTPEQFERTVREDLVETFADRPVWKVVQQPERQLTVHEILSEKVVRVLDFNGRPPLRTVPDNDGIQMGYDIILAMTSDGLAWIL